MNQSDEVVVDMFELSGHVVDKKYAEDIFWSAMDGFTYNLALLVDEMIMMRAIVVFGFFSHVVFNQI